MNAGFFKDVLERALKTFVYTLLASLSPNFFTAGGATAVGFAAAMGIAASATVLSVLGSFASFGFGTVGTAGMTKVQGNVQDWVTKEVLAVIQKQNLAVVVPPTSTPADVSHAAAVVSHTPAAPNQAATPPTAARGTSKAVKGRTRNADGTFAS